MGEVIDIDAQRPHRSSVASCTLCAQEWMAVAPLNTHVLECPACHQLAGVFFSAREVRFIRALEQIASGRSGEGAQCDVGVMRHIASDTMSAEGWPPTPRS